MTTAKIADSLPLAMAGFTIGFLAGAIVGATLIEPILR